MSEKLGKNGLLTYRVMIEAYNNVPYDNNDEEEHEDGLEAVALAERDALLDALDAMPLPEHAKEETAGLPRCGELCPACAVLADRAAFRKMVLSHE